MSDSNSLKHMPIWLQKIYHTLPPATQEMLLHFDAYESELSRDLSQKEIEEVKHIGQEIRTIRKAVGFSRLAMARKMGLDMALIVLVENGLSSKETAEFVLEAAKALKTK